MHPSVQRIGSRSFSFGVEYVRGESLLPMRRSVSIPLRTLFHFSLGAALPLAALLVASCTPQRDPGVIVLASGADRESANPLVTTHPLSRQVQRYALFVTLVRYDSTLT